MQVLLGTSANNGQWGMNFPNKGLAGDTSPGFTIDLAHKDLSLVVTAAHAAKVPMPVAASVHESFSLARAAKFGATDFSVIADASCELAHIDTQRLPLGWRSYASGVGEEWTSTGRARWSPYHLKKKK